MSGIFRFLLTLNRHLTPLLIGSGVLAVALPQLFLSFVPYTGVMLMVSLYLGCLKINVDQTLHLRENSLKLGLYVLIYQVCIPLLMYVLSLWMPLNLRLGLFLLLATSAAFSTPLFASFLNLNILWATAFTVLSTLLIPFSLPLMIDWLFGMYVPIPVLSMMGYLIKIVLVPFFAAILTKRYLPRFTASLLPASSSVGTVSMCLFFAALTAANQEVIIAYATSWHAFIVAAVAVLPFIIKPLCAALLPAATLEERKTNIVIFSYMNNGLMIMLAATYFSKEVMFVLLCSEIPWILAFPILSRVLPRLRG